MSAAGEEEVTGELVHVDVTPVSTASLECSTSDCVLHLHPNLTTSPTSDSSITHECCTALWSSCSSLAQLCHLQRHYYASTLPFTPTYHGPLHSETAAVLPHLHRLCRRLCLPTFSQPAVSADSINPYYAKAHCPQRAALSLWTSPDIAAVLTSSASHHPDLHVCSLASTPAGTAHTCSHAGNCVIAVTLIPREVGRLTARQRLSLPPLSSPSTDKADERSTVATVGGGDTLHNRQLEAFHAALSPAMRRWMQHDARMVWLIDTQWGRSDALWHFLSSVDLSASL